MRHWAYKIQQLHGKVKSLSMLIDWQRQVLQDVLGGFEQLRTELHPAPSAPKPKASGKGKRAKND